jgi:hypothetical protein
MSAPTQKNLQTPDPLVYNHVVDTYQTTFPTQTTRVANGIKANRLVGEQLYITGDAWIQGKFQTPGNFPRGLLLPDGSLAEPALRFINDTDTGIYRPGDGTMVLVSNGQPLLTTTPTSIIVSQEIATSVGNLILNPAGGAVDFSGAALINFSGISTNPNYYPVTSPANVDTFGAATAVLLSITTTTDSIYTLEVSASCLSLTDGTSAGSFIKTFRANNIGGVVTISGFIESSRSRDPVILFADILTSVSGTIVNVLASGVAGQNIRWFGGAYVTRMKAF